MSTPEPQHLPAIDPTTMLYQDQLPNDRGPLKPAVHPNGYSTYAQQRGACVLEAQGLTKAYGRGAQQTLALDHVSLCVQEGEFLGIMGPSGSGKSTLLNCISTIDRPTSGAVIMGGLNTVAMSSKQLAAFRRTELGFVFQDSNLLDTLTCYENIALALTICRVPSKEIPGRIHSLTDKLGISTILDKYPYQVSGGQAQRVAAVRATVGKPQLILADEPTGSLDSRSAAQLLDTFSFLNAMGSTLLMVTHDPISASYCSRIVFLKDGRIVHELLRGAMDRSTFLARIYETSTLLAEGSIDAA